jgi:O-antigen ligase
MRRFFKKEFNVTTHSRFEISRRYALESSRVELEEKPLSLAQICAFLAFNVLLAYLSRQSAILSTFAAWGVLLLGILWLLHDKKPIRLAYVCGYIMGAELLWRSTETRVFYEYGKYAIAFLLVLAVLKFRLLSTTSKWPVLYFILLLPSITLLPSFDRKAISFFLSGPFVLAVSTMFFSALQLTEEQLKKIFIAVIGPTVGIAILAIYSTATASYLVFDTESNFVTSGGFGPVQISLQLGFGSLLAFFYAVLEKRNRLISFLMLLLAIWLMSQSIFTFSRSGLYNSLAALLIGALFFFRARRQRINFVFIAALSVAVIYWVIFPALNEFTGGMLALRYQDMTSTSRQILARADWQAFVENPIFGVGPGQALHYHILAGIGTSSHTEYTRLLAEHGSLGLLSLLMLLGVVIARVLIKASPTAKAMIMMLTAWALLYLLNTTMRTAAPGFIFGLCGAMFVFGKENNTDES